MTAPAGLSVAGAILELLGRHGTTRVFGIPGVHNLPFWDVDSTLAPRIIGVRHEDAGETARRLAREEGILAGISSGANVWAARSLADRLPPGSIIATVLPDRAERYFSTALI